jgi:hypothetical protein
VIEGQVDHSVGRLRAAAQTIEVVEIAAMDLRSDSRERLSRRIGSDQADDLVTCVDELRNHR